MPNKKYDTYRHPLGIDCLSTLGFFQKEADDKKTSVIEEMENFYGQIETEEQREVERIMNDKAGLLAQLIKVATEANDKTKPVEIISIDDVAVSFGLRTNKTNIEFTVKCSNGYTYKAKYYNHHDSGSFYEPPDWDEDYELIERIG